MKTDKKKAKSKEMFESLVANAINFFESAVSELEEKPKYSVINFCTAIELFLKARLMLEHWSLIYEDPKTAKFNSFIQGDFKSVGMLDAIKRLKEVVDLDITKDEKECFDKIREHRNRLIHFFNEAYVNKPDPRLVEDVVAEECKGWYYLHFLLTKKWKSEFESYTHDIKRLNKLMLGKRKYLQAKFTTLLPAIEIDKRKGINFSTCQACGFYSGKEKVITEDTISVVLVDCIICEMESRELRTPCINCQDGMYIFSFGEGICNTCETIIDISSLLGSYPESVHTGSGLFEKYRAYCNNCQYIEEASVVQVGEDWVCLYCLEIHEQVGDCEYCGEFVAGNLEESFLFGCLMCDGQMSHYMNSRAYSSDD